MRLIRLVLCTGLALMAGAAVPAAGDVLELRSGAQIQRTDEGYSAETLDHLLDLAVAAIDGPIKTVRSEDDLLELADTVRALLIRGAGRVQLVGVGGEVPTAMQAMLKDRLPRAEWPVSRRFDDGFVLTLENAATGGTRIELMRMGRQAAVPTDTPPAPLAGLRAPPGAAAGESALLLAEDGASQTQTYVIPADVEFSRRHYMAELERAGFRISSFDSDGSVMLDGFADTHTVTVFLYADPAAPNETTAILTVHR